MCHSGFIRIMTEESIRSDIKQLIFEYFDKGYFNSSGRYSVPQSVPTYGPEETAEVLDTLLSSNVTMGSKVREFEQKFSTYIGTRHAIMVNSGSSANLVALTALSSTIADKTWLNAGDEIIVPSIPWATTISPILQVGAIPVFVDVDPVTCNMIVGDIEEAITTKTKGIMPVHLLGNPVDMESLMALAKKHKLFVLEDSCEAHGAKYGDKMIGSYGNLSTFSFFFSHHISTIEGGMVLTNDDSLADLCRSIRAHGWTREMSTRTAIENDFPEIDPRFLFWSTGYNLRPTEIHGSFGIHQMDKLENFIDIRRRNAAVISEALKKFCKYFEVVEESKNTRHVWFSIPIILKDSAPFDRNDLTNYLEQNGIETRPVMAGNMVAQPMMMKHEFRQNGNLENAAKINRNGFLIGNHHGLTDSKINLIIDSIGKFIAQI